MTLTALASLTLIGYTAFYITWCALVPFGRCRRRRCDNGRIHSRLSRRVFRECSRCDGTGKRVRVGRRVYEYLRGEYKAGNR